jgi:hypothetical protein
MTIEMVDGDVPDHILIDLLNRALTYDCTCVVVFLIERFGSRIINGGSYAYAIRFSSLETVKVLVNEAKKPTLELELLKNSITAERLDIVRLMIGRLRYKMPLHWRYLLNSCIQTNNLELTKYMLTHVSPATDGNQTLKVAGGCTYEMFKLILSDQRINPMMNLIEVLRQTNPILRRKRKLYESIILSDGRSGSWKSDNEPHNSTDLLIRDSRVKTEEFSVSTVRVALWILSDLVQDSEQGFNIANDLVGSELEINYLQSTLEKGDDIFSQVLRHLLFKRPAARELMKWMMGMNNRALKVAAHCVVRGVITCKCVMPLRALMLSMLHPTLSLRALIDDLRVEGTIESDVVLSARLVGAYLGESGIRTRNELENERER